MAPVTQSEDTAARYRAYGWDVYEIDGHSFEEIFETFEKAKSATSSKTLIGKGIPQVSGTNKAHGEAGVRFVPESRTAIGLPDEPFFVSPETKAYFAEHKESLHARYSEWKTAYKNWRGANKDLAAELDAAARKEGSQSAFAHSEV